jgi:tRNA(fMet)-specific endonuclease VapC
MSSCLLDTDTISYYLRNIEPVVSRAEEYLKQYGKFTTSVIAVFEIIYGCRKAGSVRREQEFHAFRQAIEVLPLDSASAGRAAALHVSLESQGIPIALPDLFIASIALEHDFTLVTNNQKHFARIIGLKLDNWLT